MTRHVQNAYNMAKCFLSSIRSLDVCLVAAGTKCTAATAIAWTVGLATCLTASLLLQLFVGLHNSLCFSELCNHHFEPFLIESQVAVVSIWGPRPPLRAAACCFVQTKHCCRTSTKCLASGPSVSRLARPIKRMLSRYSSLMIVLHRNISRCYQAMSAFHQDGGSRHFMSVGFGRVVLGVVLVMSISAASYTAPSCKRSALVQPCSFILFPHCSFIY